MKDLPKLLAVSAANGLKPVFADLYAARGFIDPRGVYTRSGAASVYDSQGQVKKLAANEPRFDYNPATLEARGLLFEAPRTNVITHSEQFDNAAWTKEADVTITANDAVAPDGTLTADKYENAGNLRGLSFTYTLATPENRIFWFDIFVKLGTLTKFTLNIRRGDASDALNLTGLTPGTTETSAIKIEPVSGQPGWYRYMVRHAFSSSTTGDDVNVRVTADFDDTGTMWVWGGMLEEAATVRDYPTSYIATSGSTVTRAGDALKYLLTDLRANLLKGTLFAEWSPKYGYVGSETFPFIAKMYGNTNDGNNRMGLIYRPNTAQLHVPAFSGGVSQAGLNIGTVAPGSIYRSGFVYEENYFNAAINGTLGTPDTSIALPQNLDTLHVGGLEGGASAVLNGWIRGVKLYKRRVTDLQLQQHTLNEAFFFSLVDPLRDETGEILLGEDNENLIPEYF